MLKIIEININKILKAGNDFLIGSLTFKCINIAPIIKIAIPIVE